MEKKIKVGSLLELMQSIPKPSRQKIVSKLKNKRAVEVNGKLFNLETNELPCQLKFNPKDRISITQHYKEFTILYTFRTLQFIDLNLSDCLLTAQHIDPISQGLSILPNVTKMNLNLSDNDLFDQGVLVLIENILKMPVLIDLDLDIAGNGITDISIMHNHLHKFTILKRMNLSMRNNQFILTADLEIEPAVFLQDLKWLKMDLCDNKISNAATPIFAYAIGLQSNLTFLELPLLNNYIELSGIAILFQNIERLKLLKHLAISFNDEREGVSKIMFNSIKALENLESLDINILEYSAFAENFSQLLKLKHLSIHFSSKYQLDSESKLFSSILEIKTLKELCVYISSSTLVSTGIIIAFSPILSEFSKLSSIKLDLNSEVDSKTLEILVGYLGALEDLEKLRLCLNISRLGSVLKAALVESLKKFVNLVFLSLKLPYDVSCDDFGSVVQRLAKLKEFNFFNYKKVNVPSEIKNILNIN